MYVSRSRHIVHFRLSTFFTGYYANQVREKIDPTDWREHRLVAVVNAFYHASQNYFEFPAGILQPPFFDNLMPRYMNYGGIGIGVGMSSFFLGGKKCPDS
jgi:putative endopeptidase